MRRPERHSFRDGMMTMAHILRITGAERGTSHLGSVAIGIHMLSRGIILALGLILCSEHAYAADSNKPEPAAVVNAMYAAIGVGNVDAAASFFTEDGYNILPGGKKIEGRQALRKSMADLWVPENVQVGPAYDVRMLGGQTALHFDMTTKWVEDLGSAPSVVVNVVTLEGDKIKSINAYYTSSTIEKMMKACEVKPDSKMPNGTTRCGQGIPFLKKYTDSLIEQGVAQKE